MRKILCTYGCNDTCIYIPDCHLIVTSVPMFDVRGPLQEGPGLNWTNKRAISNVWSFAHKYSNHRTGAILHILMNMNLNDACRFIFVGSAFTSGRWTGAPLPMCRQDRSIGIACNVPHLTMGEVLLATTLLDVLTNQVELLCIYDLFINRPIHFRCLCFVQWPSGES